MKEKKVYKTAPLPFQGQKRNFISDYKKVVTDFKDKYQVQTIIDLFGGSGLLSHVAKNMYPELRSIMITMIFIYGWLQSRLLMIY